MEIKNIKYSDSNLILFKNKNLLETKDDKYKLKSIVHDLKTPITSIMGFAELLKEKKYDETVTQEFYDIILSESGKLLELVNELLYNKDKNNSNISINFGEILEKIIQELTVITAKKNIKIILNNKIDNINVNIPKIKLSRILINIMENAVKYNKINGYIYINVLKKSNYILIKIRDTGIGIPKDEIKNIFKPYYRTSISKKLPIDGSGIGLSNVSEILKEYKGRIELNSEIGKYTEFLVSLPIFESNL